MMSSPSRLITAVAGAAMVALGIAAISTADVIQAARWIAAVGLAVAGAAGLVGVLQAGRQSS